MIFDDTNLVINSNLSAKWGNLVLKVKFSFSNYLND